MVMREGANGVETIAEDDDGLGAGTTDAGLRIELPADGEYLIVANSAATLGPQFFYRPIRASRWSRRWALPSPRTGRRCIRAAAAASDKYAVVVGISDYPGDE